MNERASPSTNGHGGQGRFVRGNKAGKGNPLVRHVAAFRSSLLSAAAPDEIRNLVRQVIAEAASGDKDARKLFFERILPYFIGNFERFAQSQDVRAAQQPFTFVFPRVGDGSERRYIAGNLTETGAPPS